MDTPQFVTIPLSEYQQLLEGLQEISKLRAELEYLQERTAREIALDRQRITELENKQNEPSAKETTKTIKKRIKALKAILRSKGGSQTFKQLQKDLDLSQSQFSKLLNKLDKREFEVIHRPGSPKEKVLILRKRLYDPLPVDSHFPESDNYVR